jgi:hypothetical protein
MRRYAVRFLVAVLTFGIGILVSLAFGLFTVKNTAVVHWEQSPPKSCSKRFRIVNQARPAFLTIDTLVSDPLKLVYLGATPEIPHGEDVRMRFSVENNGDKTISGYSISASEIWARDGVKKNLDWTAFEVLEPGQTSTISLPRNAEGFSLRVAKVNFQDGSTWINPRVLQ